MITSLSVLFVVRFCHPHYASCIPALTFEEFIEKDGIWNVFTEIPCSEQLQYLETSLHELAASERWREAALAKGQEASASDWDALTPETKSDFVDGTTLTVLANGNRFQTLVQLYDELCAFAAS